MADPSRKRPRTKYGGPRPESHAKSVAKRIENAKAGRRQGVDPATCDRIYDDEEREFLMAVEKYKKERRRPFPTFSEILQIAHALGYRKVSPSAG